jgi:hypothetical protein
MLAYGAVPRLKCGVDYALSPLATYTVVICNVPLTSIRAVHGSNVSVLINTLKEVQASLAHADRSNRSVSAR